MHRNVELDILYDRSITVKLGSGSSGSGNLEDLV